MDKPANNQLAELSKSAQDLLNDYRPFWKEKLAECQRALSDDEVRTMFHSLYEALDLPAPLVVIADSPLQLMLMPALLRIRALCDESTWQFVQERLQTSMFKATIQSLQENVCDHDIESLVHNWKSRTNSAESSNEETLDSRANSRFLDTVFGRPKGQRVDSRLGFFETLISKLALKMSDALSPQIREWIINECLWPDGGFPGELEDFVNHTRQAEVRRLQQLRLAVQNLSNMGTTERAALMIFRARGDGTSFVSDEMVKQGALETQFLQQLGEETVSALAHALSARNLEPTIFESYPPVLESMLDGNSTGLWFTGQLAVGFNSIIMHPQIERLPELCFLIDAGEQNVYDPSTQNAIESLRLFMANRTPVCPFEEVVFVCRPALAVRLDEEGRLHSLEHPAIEYKDGFRIYSINGVTVDERTVMTPEALTVNDIETEVNLEFRRIMMERFGIPRYLSESKAEIISEDQYGTLYRRAMRGDEPLVMVRVINSTPEPDGTFKEYFLRVPPDMRTAKEAVAWTFNFEEEDYKPDQES